MIRGGCQPGATVADGLSRPQGRAPARAETTHATETGDDKRRPYEDW